MSAPTNALAEVVLSPEKPRPRPKLGAFHRDPPRPLTIRLEALDHDRLDLYTRFYNDTFGADVQVADVAAHILAEWMNRDRAFRGYRPQADATAG